LHVTFVTEHGTEIVRQHVEAEAIQPGSRFTFASWQFPELHNQRFAAFIRSANGTPFEAERAVYWGAGFIGGHASLGTPWGPPLLPVP
jgi:hypothetical protein